MITQFKEEYRWLSNFCRAEVQFEGRWYRSGEGYNMLGHLLMEVRRSLKGGKNYPLPVISIILKEKEKCELPAQFTK